MKIAIVGATGAVGQQMLQCLEERNVPGELKLLASARSVGKKFTYKGQEITVEELCEEQLAMISQRNGCHGHKKIM